MSTHTTYIKCKQCGEEIIKIIHGGKKLFRPRRISKCKGYHSNAFDPKTLICKSVSEE